MRLIHKLVAAAALALGATAALAQAWPNRPVRLVIPYPAGGSIDTVARIIAPRIAEHLGQQVIVDNRIGADSLIGTRSVVTAQADGYTLLMQAPTMLINRALQPNLWLDPVKELQYIAPVASTPFFLIVSPNLGPTNMKELVTLARGTKRQLDYASASAATMLAEKLMSSAAGYDSMFVPFKGSAAALTAVIAGDASYSLDTLTSIRGFVESGRIKVLATTAPERSPALPNVPTLAESGLANFQFISWWGIMGPIGLPADVVAKVNAAVEKTVNEPEVRAKLEGLGATPMKQTPQAFGAFAAKEQDRFVEVVKINRLEIKQ